MIDCYKHCGNTTPSTDKSICLNCGSSIINEEAAKSELERFKSALREEIEKQLNSQRGMPNVYTDGKNFAFKVVLDLIDSVTPKP